MQVIFLCNPDRLLIKYCSVVLLGCYYVFFCYIIFVPSYYFSVVSHLLPTESICSGQNIKGSRNTELSEALLLVWINPVGGFAYALTPCSANQIAAPAEIAADRLVPVPLPRAVLIDTPGAAKSGLISPCLVYPLPEEI